MFKIPNDQTSPLSLAQAVPDSTDYAAITATPGGTGVVSGCVVSAQTSPNFTVKGTAGSVVINGLQVSVTANTTITIATVTTTDRRDIITINSSGAYVVTKGTACGTATWVATSSGLPPVKPAIPATSVLVAEIMVKHGSTSIASTNVTSKGVVIAGLVRGAVMTAIQTVGTTTPAVITQLTVPLVPTQAYNFEVDLFASNSSTAFSAGGVILAVLVPTGATLVYNAQAYPTAGTTVHAIPYQTTTGTIGGLLTTTGTGGVQMSGAVIMGTATGNLQIEFASNTGSTASIHGTATMLVGSNIVVTPI